jgi:hypothetical protein
MVVEIKIEVDGLFAWLAEHPEAVKRSRIATLARAAHKVAFNEWAQKHGAIGLEERFTADAFNTLGLTPRGKGYQNRQHNVLRRTLPFTSPDHNSGTMRRAVLSNGWRIQNKNNGGDAVETEMTITGARGLNRIKAPFGDVYRREFLGFDRGGRGDAQWIEKRAAELFRDALVAEIQKAQKRELRRVAR